MLSVPGSSKTERSVLGLKCDDPLPLRSVENTKLQVDIGKARGKQNTMNEANNNCSISSKIRTEPFMDYYSVEIEIGRGKFAVVKRCRHNHSGVEYAAKFLRKRRKGKDCRHEILSEIAMLEMAREHPRLVDLVEVFETSHDLILVTEYASGGELYQRVVLEERLPEPMVIKIMRQTLEGLVFLHSRSIVHLDVKPQNILLTNVFPHGDIKLCDFGFARAVRSGDDIRDIIGTPDYVAPEILSYEPITTAADMWSLGVVAYVLLTGYSPFEGDTKQETFCNISQLALEFPDDLFEDISPQACDFIEKLLVLEPTERMSSQSSLNHAWLESETVGAAPTASPSPFGSPLGCRRALTPSTPDSSLELQEPSKRCRCDSESCNENAEEHKKSVNANTNKNESLNTTNGESKIQSNHKSTSSSVTNTTTATTSDSTSSKMSMDEASSPVSEKDSCTESDDKETELIIPLAASQLPTSSMPTTPTKSLLIEDLVAHSDKLCSEEKPIITQVA